MRDPSWIRNPGQTSPKFHNRGISDPKKRTYLLQVLLTASKGWGKVMFSVGSHPGGTPFRSRWRVPQGTYPPPAKVPTPKPRYIPSRIGYHMKCLIHTQTNFRTDRKQTKGLNHQRKILYFIFYCYSINVFVLSISAILDILVTFFMEYSYKSLSFI